MRPIQSNRLQQLGSAIFAEVGAWKKEAEQRGHSLIDLGIGSPDQPPSAGIMRALEDAVRQPGNFGYPTSEGSPEFRHTAAKWYKHRFGVELDPEREILTLMGSQDGLSHLALAVTNPGDIAIVPDPGYPIYSAALTIAGVKPYFVPLREQNDFLPDLTSIPEEIAGKAKFMLLNYPSNPLSATADKAFFEQWIAFAKRHQLLLVHDAAYSELAFDGHKPMSLLELPDAKEVAVEFHSLSKSFNMAGCRIAMLVGRRDVVQALKILKSNIDYGVFMPVQQAGIAALEEDMEQDESVSALYAKRRDAFCSELSKHGWEVRKPKATMFVWAQIPKGWTSRQISREILLSTGVVVIPGDAFGAEGEGYVRIALVKDVPILTEAARKIGKFVAAYPHGISS